MKKLVCALFLAVFLSFFTARVALALDDPTTLPNNQFGIHIVDENDLKDASLLVNSEGGDWGYVTMVIQQWDRDPVKWQQILTKMESLHLIPIIRIASQPQKKIWGKLEDVDIENWVTFLSNLSWPTIDRYIIIGNEPNHSKEWGGDINPEEYSRYLKSASQKLKTSNSNFFVLPAGLDASAPNSMSTMDEVLFLQKMVAAEPDIFNYIDGWTSHSYPNPAFSGSETDSGRGTVATFEWELELLKSLGVSKNLPVFITETGWVHSMNGKYPILAPTQEVGTKFKYAFENVWNKPNIVAVTPFILNYQTYPFETFSWKDTTNQYYSFYFEIQALPKIKGKPKLPEKPRKYVPQRLPVLNPTLALFYINSEESMHNLAIFDKI